MSAFPFKPKKVLETLAQAPYTALNKTQRVALATMVFNVSCQGLRFPLENSLRDQSISLINKVCHCSILLIYCLKYADVSLSLDPRDRDGGFRSRLPRSRRAW